MIYTVERPEGHKILNTFGMVEATTVVRLSELTGLNKMFEGDGASHQDAMNALADVAPNTANAIVGVRVSTACCTDGEGKILLLITYIGTPVEIDPPPPVGSAAK